MMMMFKGGVKRGNKYLPRKKRGEEGRGEEMAASSNSKPSVRACVAAHLTVSSKADALGHGLLPHARSLSRVICRDAGWTPTSRPHQRRVREQIRGARPSRNGYEEEYLCARACDFVSLEGLHCIY